MSKLTILGENQNLARKVQVDIVTAADPHPGALLFARECIRQHGDVAEAFSGDKVDLDYLDTALRRYFPEEEAYRVPQVVQYLVDEHEQLGGDGSILLLDPTSGRAMARLSPEDFYVPAMVPRESGNMVSRGPQVKPELMGMITQHLHDTGRDKVLRETMLSRIPQGGNLPVEVTKRQTLFVTKGGRKQTAALVHDRLSGLIDGATGIAKALFDLFPRVAEPIVLEEGVEGYWTRPVEWTATVQRGVQDPTTQNLRFDPVVGATASITTSWARLLGYELVKYAVTLGGRVATPEQLSWPGLYIAGPDTSKRIAGHTLVVNAPEGVAVYLEQGAGKLHVADYGTEYREVHDKWSVKCTVLGTLYGDWSRMRVMQVEGVEADPVTEIVS